MPTPRRGLRPLDDPDFSGLDDPSLDDPGVDDPSLGDPGLDDPGLDDPGVDDPGVGRMVTHFSVLHSFPRIPLISPYPTHFPLAGFRV